MNWVGWALAYSCLSSVEGAMTPSSLAQYFRSFLVKLNMIESQIGQMYLGGEFLM